MEHIVAVITWNITNETFKLKNTALTIQIFVVDGGNPPTPH